DQELQQLERPALRLAAAAQRLAVPLDAERTERVDAEHPGPRLDRAFGDEPTLPYQRADVVGLDTLLERARTDARHRGRPPPEEMLVAVLPPDREPLPQRLEPRARPAMRERHVGKGEQAGELEMMVGYVAHDGAYALQLGDAFALVAALEQHLREREPA